MNEYFYIEKATNQQCGPFSIDELKARNIAPDTMVWRSGMSDWVRANTVSDLAGLFSTQAINNSPSVSPVTTQYQQPQQSQQGGMYDNNVYGYGRRRPADGANLSDVYPMPKSWLVESILVTIFCCIPFGIAAILNASKVESLYYAGDYEGSEKASKDAKKWAIVAFCSLFVGIILYVIFYVVLVGIIIGAESL